MAVTTIRNQTLCFCDGLVKILGFIHCQNRRQFLMCELFTDIYRLNLTDQDLGILRNGNTSHLRNLESALAYNLRVQGTIDEDCLSYFLDLIRF